MTIEQAFFGDNNGSHNLLHSTITDNTLIGKLKSMTDKPSSIDVDYPYLSGYKINAFYVFCKTFKDPNAKRGGMVFTHCLIIPLTKLGDLNNLFQIFRHFAPEPTKDFASIQPIGFDTNAIFDLPEPSIYDAVIDNLINNKNTSIFLGYDEFEEVIQYLWYHLPLLLRENFSFTISGTPNEIKNERYTLIHTPLDYINKWSGFSIIKSAKNIENKTQAHLFLSDSSKTKSITFNQFVAENEIELLQIHQLSSINKCIELEGKVKENADFQNIRNLIPEITKVIPTPDKGLRLKGVVLQKFVNAIKHATATNIKSIRNLHFDAFENGQREMEKVLEGWTITYISTVNQAGVHDIADLLSIAFGEEKSNWWNLPIIDRVKSLCKKMDKQISTFIWSIWKENSDLIEIFRNFIPPDSESKFSDTMPDGMPNNWYKTVSEFALRKTWFSLYALTTAKQFDVKKSVELQIEYDTQNLYDNLLLIAEKTSAKGFLLASLELDNNTAYKASGKLCADSPVLFEYLDIKNYSWQIIWHESFQFTKDIKKGIKAIKSLFYALLDLAIDKKPINDNLISTIEPQIDSIYDYKNRSVIWEALPLNIKDNLLNKTSQYVFENYKEINFRDLEYELLQNIKKQSFVRQFILSSNKTVKYKMQFLEKASILTEQIGIEVIKPQVNIQGLEVDYIVEKIRENRWQALVNHLYENASHHNNFGGVLQECKNMLSIWQRLFISVGQKTSASDIIRMIDSDNLSSVFNILDKINHNGGTYSILKDEFVQGHSKGKDRKELCDRLKVYVSSL